jgi:hypothetical protein
MKYCICLGVPGSNPEKVLRNLLENWSQKVEWGIRDPSRRKSQEFVNELFTVTGNWGSFLLEILQGSVGNGCQNFRSNGQLTPSLKASWHSITHFFIAVWWNIKDWRVSDAHVILSSNSFLLLTLPSLSTSQ